MAKVVIQAGTGRRLKMLTTLEFSTRLGFDNESVLQRMTLSADVPLSVRADITTATQWLNRAAPVDPTDERTILLSNACVGWLSSAALCALVSATELDSPAAAALLARMLDPEGPEGVDP